MVDELLPTLELVARDGRPLVIIAEEIEGQLLAALIINRMRNNMKIVAVKAPRYGEERRAILEDVAVTTGATLISKEKGLRLHEVKLEHLGTARRVEITKYHTTIADGDADYDLLEQRSDMLRGQIEETEDTAEALRIQERLTRLSSAIAVIR